MDEELRSYRGGFEARLIEVDRRPNRRRRGAVEGLHRQRRLRSRNQDHHGVKWGRTSDMRTRQALTEAGMLGERMLALEDRISALERKAS
jgi:hypothetical protein